MNNVITYIGLGANLDDPKESILLAFNEITNTNGILQATLSSLYDTSPVGCIGPDYINAVARVHTSLSAIDLLHSLQNIENNHGRTRPFRFAPRTLDLDILLYGDLHISTPELTLPHPRMHERAFVLKPLIELAPDLVLPQGSLTTLLDNCSNQSVQLI